MAGSEKVRAKRTQAFACAVPEVYCTGTRDSDKRSWEYNKYHTSQESCKACMTAYLLKQGYKKVGSNVWDPGGDKPYLVVPRKFQRVKPGKGSKKSYMAQPLKVRNCLPLPK